MKVKEIFDLRKQGKIEEAYEAIKARYANYRGHYTTLCMFWTASDVFKKRLAEGRTEEARKIFLVLQRLVPFLSDRDGRVTAFMQYASSRLESAQRFSRCDVPSSAQRFSRSGVPSCLSPLDGASASSLVSPFHGAQDPKLQRLLNILKGDMSVREMMAALGFASRDKFLKQLSE